MVERGHGFAGDFVVTWSSYGQEQGATQGLGYGVSAQKYDSYGSVVLPEFQVISTPAATSSIPTPS